MAEVIDYLIEVILEGYESILSFLPAGFDDALQVLIFAILIALISVFIWYFYKSLSERSLIKLNLNQYNRTEHPTGYKFIASLFYLLEYIIIMPFLISIWFAALSIIILVIADERSIVQVLTLTAAMVLSIRILAYHKREIAQELAKLFPFITLSFFILTPGSLNLGNYLPKLNEVPSLLNSIFYFLVVILVVETVLRLFYTIVLFWRSEEGEGDENEED